jgi:hypothetical protein
MQSRVVLWSQHKCSSIIYTSPSSSISACSLKFGTTFVVVMVWGCICIPIHNTRRCSNHLIYVQDRCVMQSEVVKGLNTSAVASFAQVNHLGIQSALQVVYLWSPPWLLQQPRLVSLLYALSLRVWPLILGWECRQMCLSAPPPNNRLGYKPYHYAVVEAPYPSKAACTSMWSTYKMFDHFISSGWAYGTIGNPLPSPALVVPEFESWLTSSWVLAGLQTLPLCSGWGSKELTMHLHQGSLSIK